MLAFSLFLLFWVFTGLLSLVLFGLIDKGTNDDHSDEAQLLIAIGCGGPLSIIVGGYALIASYIFDRPGVDVEGGRLHRLFICYYYLGKGLKEKK